MPQPLGGVFSKSIFKGGPLAWRFGGGREAKENQEAAGGDCLPALFLFPGFSQRAICQPSGFPIERPLGHFVGPLNPTDRLHNPKNALNVYLSNRSRSPPARSPACGWGLVIRLSSAAAPEVD
eukprot:gene8646-6075_t